MKDLFENYEELPKNVYAFIEDFEKNVDTGADRYAECEKLLARMVCNGYTFDYGLDGEPFGLTKIN
ncbi:MAG: hypothetical protein WD512_19005 [Candidatus Paceibacterota bacterium]